MKIFSSVDSESSLSWAGLEKLGDVTQYPVTMPEELVSQAAEAEVLILTVRIEVTAETLDRLPRLRFITVTGTGYSNLDIVAARARGIPVSNVPGYSTESVAQHAMALLLELTNHVGVQAVAVAAGEWRKCADEIYLKTPLVDLTDLSLGIVGMGRIGRRMGEIARGFGMNILYSGREEKTDLPFPATYLPVEELFAEADVVSLHGHQTPENLQFVNAALLRRMKPTALLINTARGGLIHEADLADALEQGVLAGAGLDILADDPPFNSNPLLRAPRCVITPHVAWSSPAARRRLVQITLDNIAAFLAGAPIHVVN